MVHKNDSEKNNPTIIRRSRYSKAQSNSVEQSRANPRKKRWATSVKKGHSILVSGPCEILVRRVDLKECELCIVMDENVFVQKVIVDVP